MRLQSVRAGDIVEVEKTGAEFFAFVVDKDQDGLQLRPICPVTLKYRPRTARHASAREVKGHWALRAGASGDALRHAIGEGMPVTS